MLNYFKGQVIQISKQANNRHILILEVQGIGYEIQITSYLAETLPIEDGKLQQIFTHLQLKEDSPYLYGFITTSERDIFRQLITVTGIGAQLALALIDSLGVEKLIQAIVSENLASLIKTPGVGNKTAERLILELKSKLAQWYKITTLPSSTEKETGKPPLAYAHREGGHLLPPADLLRDLEMTLLALGYEDREIEREITKLSLDEKLVKNSQIEEWIKRAIADLS